jgi:GT2 family glycosyltransferase
MYYSIVTPSIKPIAAACMFFSRKTWEETPFIENSPRFDSDFCRRIQQKGGKLAICKGLYVFHKYRLGDPTLSPKHLL